MPELYGQMTDYDFDFVSDNTDAVSPEILEALSRNNDGQQMSYGADEVSARLQQQFSDLFECDCRVYPVATGTAANALSLALLSPAWGKIYCHSLSHVADDECGAPEFYTGGAKLALLDGPDGKIRYHDLQQQLSRSHADVHAVQPAALSITQQTEAGTHYSLDEIDALCSLARDHDLGVHMDGARFANALVALDCSPARMTWQAGVDLLSFGATKNGAMAVEAIVLFQPERARELELRRMRGGHLMSKSRYASAQLEAYLDDDLWLRNARHANAMAARLFEGINALPGVSFDNPVEGNQLFPRLSPDLLTGFRAAGFRFFEMGGPGIYRLVTAFNTRAEDVDRFVALARKLATV